MFFFVISSSLKWVSKLLNLESVHYNTEIMLIRYVNVKSIINFHSRNQDADFDILEMFLAFNVLNIKRRIQNFQKKRDVRALKKQIGLFCTIVTHRVLLCYTASIHFRWVRWDPK